MKTHIILGRASQLVSGQKTCLYIRRVYIPIYIYGCILYHIILYYIISYDIILYYTILYYVLFYYIIYNIQKYIHIYIYIHIVYIYGMFPINTSSQSATQPNWGVLTLHRSVLISARFAGASLKKHSGVQMLNPWTPQFSLNVSCHILAVLRKLSS